MIRVGGGGCACPRVDSGRDRREIELEADSVFAFVPASGLGWQIVNDNLLYAKVVVRMGVRSECKNCDFSDILEDEQVSVVGPHAICLESCLWVVRGARGSGLRRAHVGGGVLGVGNGGRGLGGLG